MAQIERVRSTESTENLRVASEQTPLLSGQHPSPADLKSSKQSALDHQSGEDGDNILTAGGANNNDDDDEDVDDSLPIWQLVPLCVARVVEPAAFFSIFPFINQMVKDNGQLEYGEVGFYSGLIESLFSLTQMTVMLFWGRASDRHGRKPVLVVSLIGVGITMGCFGLARTLTQMIVLRCCAGVFAGTVVTLRTMFFEISTPRNQARIFSWFAFMSNCGIFIGPLIGGALAEPAKQYPRVFAGVALFETFPYFLPTLAVGALGLTAALVVVLFVNETLPKKPVDETMAGAGTAAKPEPPSTRSLLASKGVPAVLGIYGYVMFLAFSYTALITTFYFTPVPLGGYGFKEIHISVVVALNGVSQAAWLLAVFPAMHKRFGTGGMLRGCAMAYPFFFLAYPLLNLVLRIGTKEADIVFWILLVLLTTVGSGVSMSFTACQLAVNDICPSREILATLNALALAANSGIRAVAPGAITSLYAIGVKYRILGGEMIWAILIPFAIGYNFIARSLPEEADKKPKSRPSSSRHEE